MQAELEEADENGDAEEDAEEEEEEEAKKVEAPAETVKAKIGDAAPTAEVEALDEKPVAANGDTED